jgi:MFS family permease
MSQTENDGRHIGKQLLGLAAGLVVGAFLFRRFGYGKENDLLHGWQWYLGTVLLAGIALAGLIPEASLISTIALAIAPSLVFCYEVVYLHPAESMWPVMLPMLFLFSFPVPIIGSIIAKQLTRTRFTRTLSLIALTSALVIGFLLPNLRKN